MTLVLVSFIFYFHHMQCANILGIFPFPSHSHQFFLQAIWRELSLSGHNVTVVTTDPLNDPLLTNLTEIDLHHLYQITKGNRMQKGLTKNPFQNLDFGCRLTDTISEMQFDSEQFQKLIENKSNKFDLILLECFFFASYSLASRFGAPTIAVSPMGVLPAQYNVLGSPNHPVLYRNMLSVFTGQKISFWEKVINGLFGMWSVYHHYYHILPRTDAMVKKYLGNDNPHVGDLEKNVSMLLVNSNPPLDPPRPNVPGILETGSLHIKPAKRLPQDLQNILNKSRGVVYFSLGTNIKSVFLDEKLRNIIIEALSELPYKVIWKWESDFLPNKPSNVIIRKWVPQQDILAHPNVKAFVTQGGIQSTAEAIYRAVPMVIIPFIIDQPFNARKMAELGIAVALDPQTLTKEELIESIRKVSKNITYKKQIETIRKFLIDKQVQSIENVVWWCQYVIRHKGARHLRSPSADISWFHFLILDVVFAFVSAVTILTYGTYKLTKFAKSKKKL